MIPDGATVVYHKSVFDIPKLQQVGLNPSLTDFEDTKLASFVINENRLTSLKPLAKEILGVDAVDYKDVDRTDTEEFAKYARNDADWTLQLWEPFRRQIEEQELQQVYELEKAVVPVVLSMETQGMLVDQDKLAALAQTVNAKLSEATDQVDKMLLQYRLTGEAKVPDNFNINSTKQLGEFLYGKEGLGLQCHKFTKKKAPSTDSEALTKLDHPFAKAMLAQREHQKIATFIEKLPQHIEPDGRIRPTFNQMGTPTGRFACVSADTLIEMPRDLVSNPLGIPITSVVPGDWVYSFDWERQLCLKQVKWVGKTGVRQTVIITVENSVGHRRELRLTPEHLVRLYHGDWRPAGSLLHRHGDARRNDGPRIMPMVKRHIDDGYIKFFPNSIAKGNGSKGGGKSREHRWVLSHLLGKRISTKCDVHHIDGNRTNNHPDNLEELKRLEHRGSLEVHPWWGSNGSGVADLYTGPNDFRVVSVEDGPVEDVWDMEVEDTHNFIANGICVHNCSTPNVQQVPLHSEIGKQLRECFVAPAGRKLVVADYSQMELRVLAHYSQDPTLLHAFKTDEDLHVKTAAKMFGKKAVKVSEDPDGVTDDERFIAKMINFGIVYGLTAVGLFNRLQAEGKTYITLTQCEEFIRLYFETYPGVARFLTKVKRLIETQHYVRTIYGRRRRLQGRFDREIRQAQNFVIQGSAADLCKQAMVYIHNELPADCYIIAMIHDELLVECPDELAETCQEIVVRNMKRVPYNFRVPIKIDAHVAQSWGLAKG
jgi:DNA polymerase I-like protein with 3'-5' exonuclease and polymerase domains